MANRWIRCQQGFPPHDGNMQCIVTKSPFNAIKHFESFLSLHFLLIVLLLGIFIFFLHFVVVVVVL